MSGTPKTASPIDRRKMLGLLGIATSAAYVAPALLSFSQARASGASRGSRGSGRRSRGSRGGSRGS